MTVVNYSNISGVNVISSFWGQFLDDTDLDPFVDALVAEGVVPTDLTDVTVEAATSVLDAVYLDSDGTYKRAKADDISTASVIGFVIEKPTSTTADIRKYGVVDGFTGLTVTGLYFLSSTTDGGITTSVVGSPGHVRIGVGVAISTTKLMVDINLSPGVAIKS